MGWPDEETERARNDVVLSWSRQPASGVYGTNFLDD